MSVTLIHEEQQGELRPLCDHTAFIDKFCVTALSSSKDGQRLFVSLTLKSGGKKAMSVHLRKDKSGRYWIDRNGNAYMKAEGGAS